LRFEVAVALASSSSLRRLSFDEMFAEEGEHKTAPDIDNIVIMWYFALRIPRDARKVLGTVPTF
jgi:hypothetical protein